MTEDQPHIPQPPAYYDGWDTGRIEQRIEQLARRVRVSSSLDTRAMLRHEIDLLLEEHLRATTRKVPANTC